MQRVRVKAEITDPGYYNLHKYGVWENNQKAIGSCSGTRLTQFLQLKCSLIVLKRANCYNPNRPVEKDIFLMNIKNALYCLVDLQMDSLTHF